MFKFLKDKLKSAISKISEGVEKEGKVEESVIEKKPDEPAKEEKGFFAKLKEKIVGKAEEPEEKPAVQEKPKEAAEEAKAAGPEAKEEAVYKDAKTEEPAAELEALKKTTKDKEIGGSDIPEFYQKTEKMHDDEKFRKKSQKTYEKSLEEAKKEKPRHETKKAVHEYQIKKIEEKPIKQESVKEEKKPEAAIPKEGKKEEIPAHAAQIPAKKEAEEKPDAAVKKEPEKKGFFATLTEKIITTRINSEQFEKLFWELELALMENNVAVEVIEKIKNDLKVQLVEKPIRRTKVEETIASSLKGSIEELFLNNNIDLIEEIKNKAEKPYVIAFFGINGSGKTTSIAKLASMLKENGISCVLAAADTFRAASIEQLQLHADKIGVKLVKHNYGADPAAVAFDAIKHAKARGIGAVLIDTAGRMHSNTNLVDEMKKIVRVAKPDLKVFVGESITGNDCVEQAKTFNDAIGIDGIILAKADVDEKGGAAISISYVTKKPILYLGTGQGYSDIEKFSREKVLGSIGLA